jgi:hypothetical protein
LKCCAGRRTLDGALQPLFVKVMAANVSANASPLNGGGN